MPGFDRTGPAGMGPMTGGGRGFCGPAGAGLRRFYPGYRGFGLRQRGYWPLAQADSGGLNLDELKKQADAIRQDLKTLESRIEELSQK